MRDDLDDLRRLEPVVEATPDMSDHLRRMTAGDQRRQRDDAAIPQREFGTFPVIFEQHVVGVPAKRRIEGVDVGLGDPGRRRSRGFGAGGIGHE